MNPNSLRILRLADAPEGGGGTATPTIEDLQKQITDLVATNAATAKSLAKSDARISELIRDNKNLADENAEWESDNKDLTKQLNAKPANGLQKKIDDLTDANADLQTQIEELKAAKAQADADENLIREKMAVGLSRDQAAATIARQRAFDAHNETLKPQREAERLARQRANPLAQPPAPITK